MPRRNMKRVSVSARQSANAQNSANSEQSDNSNLDEEFPDPGLPKTDSNDKTMKRRKTKGELKEVVANKEDLENIVQNDQRELPLYRVSMQKKTTPPDFIDIGTRRREVAKKKEAMKEAQEASKREEEARREAIRRSVEEKKIAKAQEKEFNKILMENVAEDAKSLVIDIHPTLAIAWFMQEAIRDAERAGITVRPLEPEDICDPGLVYWSRSEKTLASQEGQVKLSPKKTWLYALQLMPAEQLLGLVSEHRALPFIREKHALTPPTRALVLMKHSGINFATYGIDANGFSKIVDCLQLELTVSLKMDVHMVTNPAELSAVVQHYARAFAEVPRKKRALQLDNQAAFYMRGEKNFVTVDKDGNGLSRLFEQMLAVLPQSSLEISRSLAAEYKSPLQLMQALEAPGGEDKVADLGVARNTLPGTKSRRLGNEFARKLNTLFTAEDGDMVID